METARSADERVPETTAYRSESSLSRRLHGRALAVMPGGNTRHSIALSPYPVYAASGKGCRVRDVEGQERIDFINNFTSLILGHADPRVTRAVCARVEIGAAFSMPTAAGVDLAELLVSRLPHVEKIRFCNSGSEAVMLALKAARAFTGRARIAKFEGAYHGIYDYAQASDSASPETWGNAAAPASVLDRGSPPAVASDVVVLPWNDLQTTRDLITRHGARLAAVLFDPLPAGIGLVPPEPGFLEMLREETARRGIVLIDDEVMSFRISYRGALAEYGIPPDLVCLAKIIGGGYPVGAVAGPSEVMSVFDHTRSPQVHHSGTFNANPLTMTAGLETMKQMTEEAFGRLDRMGEYLREQLARRLLDRGIAIRITGKGSLFAGHLMREAPRDYRSFVQCSRPQAFYTELCHRMLACGIVSSGRGIFGCLSMPMTDAELDSYVDAVERSLVSLDYRD